MSPSAVAKSEAVLGSGSGVNKRNSLPLVEATTLPLASNIVTLKSTRIDRPASGPSATGQSISKPLKLHWAKTMAPQNIGREIVTAPEERVGTNVQVPPASGTNVVREASPRQRPRLWASRRKETPRLIGR